MASDDSTPGRCFTADDTELADSPYHVLHRPQSNQLDDEELAGGLLALVDQCSEFSVPVSNVRIVIRGTTVEIEVPTKTLRIVPCCDEPSKVTWADIQRWTPHLPPTHEWLIVSTRPLTTEAKRRVEERRGDSAMHYIELSGPVREAKDAEPAWNSDSEDIPADCFSRVENYWIRKPVLTAPERRLRRN
jgi:hypothetical protein